MMLRILTNCAEEETITVFFPSISHFIKGVDGGNKKVEFLPKN